MRAFDASLQPRAAANFAGVTAEAAAASAALASGESELGAGGVATGVDPHSSNWLSHAAVAEAAARATPRSNGGAGQSIVSGLASGSNSKALAAARQWDQQQALPGRERELFAAMQGLFQPTCLRLANYSWALGYAASQSAAESRCGSYV